MLVGLVFIVVDTNDIHRSLVLGRSGHDDLLGTTLKMRSALFLGQVNTT